LLFVVEDCIANRLRRSRRVKMRSQNKKMNRLSAQLLVKRDLAAKKLGIDENSSLAASATATKYDGKSRRQAKAHVSEVSPAKGKNHRTMSI
jgi:hypothetical protein